jgi:ectoine hydroxylase-related dioxygenase (phytanoyl-CoA dioxygenase family)
MNAILAKIEKDGFSVVNDIFTDEEINHLLKAISLADHGKALFRKNAGLFAIRQFLKQVPVATGIIFNHKLRSALFEIFGDDYFLVKSIYFDKPEASNWFVAYHQDLTIAVDKKQALEGFGPWTIKQNQFAVQPPLEILQDNFTLRIHLDHTDENNGALKVIPNSHLRGLYRPGKTDLAKQTECICDVNKGGIMLMKPLLLHASGRTTNHAQRRVVHLEFSRSILPGDIDWAECIQVWDGV